MSKRSARQRAVVELRRAFFARSTAQQSVIRRRRSGADAAGFDAP